MKVFKKIDLNPTNINLYSAAVTHSSFTNENPSYPNYERLEFLGDAVLEIIISEYLYKERKLEEGVMTRMRASYVCEEACATYAKEIGLDLDIKLGSGENLNQTILADVFEAFVAAIYLDQGFDFTKKFVLNIITKYIEDGVEFLHDYKSTLQELVQTVKKSIVYEVIEETGPAHNKTFTSIVKIDGIKMGKGTGNSKKASEQEAARDALSKQAKVKE
ncbi:MAG: ribonuclease III [Bacilli bacterium]|nr:ribonuclease III [Bacilli bacterium]